MKSKSMRIPGKRVKRSRLVQTESYVVSVVVEAVIPPDDPSEPCYESETVNFLKEVEERAKQMDLDWLLQRGRVYELVATE
ncbi:MAG: hypothetical protein QGG53_17850 [Planctomycetota bacterium]|jgi:hypothetical protein|nr:hypothetical protein [Planctomycetota bacterium]